MKKFCFLLTLALLIIIPAVFPGHAQNLNGKEATTSELAEASDLEASISHWDTLFTETENYLGQNSFNAENSESLFNRLSETRNRVLELREESAKQKQQVLNLLDALGEKPGEDEQPETGVLLEKRTKYGDELSKIREQAVQIDLALVRIDELLNGLSSLRRGLIVQEISTRYPSPVDVQTLYHALREVVGHIESMLLAPTDWYSNLSSKDRDRLEVWPTVLVTVFSVLLGLFLRSWILRRYGRDTSNYSPSNTLKVSAAIAEGVARGVVPLLALFGLALWIAQHSVSVEGLFSDMLKEGFRAGIYFVLFATLANAVLSPEHPGWRLINLDPVATRVVGYALIALIAVVAVDSFIVASTRALPISESMQSVYITLMILLKGSLILLICLGRWWEPGEVAGEGDQQTRPAPRERRGLTDYLRRFVILIAVAGIIASLAGYANLAMYLIENLIKSVALVLLLLGLRAILMEVLGAATRSRFLRQRFGLKIITLQRIRLWAGGLVSAALLIAGFLQLLLIWGVGEEDLGLWLSSLVTGFTLGNITISLGDILLAICVFIAAMVATRLFQRSLLNSILPQFTSNRSVQHSLSSLAGYVGITLAVMMFIAALGINLENIVLVAGALSVGIGFGLQNIVNNFVSGLILILERPVKVGDWVVVGENEGFVQQINFRATELETFTRAAVIIPNAEMLSNSVTNLTYHDKTSRIDIPLQVAYGTDPDRVVAILKKAATDQEAVLNYPETFVLLTDFGADGLCFELRCYIRDATQKLLVASDIRLQILQTLNAAGIEIPFPQRVVHIADRSPETSNHEGSTAAE